MMECRHGMPSSQCAYCVEPGTVYVSEFGQFFHKRPDCWALAEGQGLAVGQGGSRTPVRPVTRGAAIQNGRVACRTCYPPSTVRQVV
jgi:hypothetical protein